MFFSSKNQFKTLKSILRLKFNFVKINEKIINKIATIKKMDKLKDE